MVWLRQFHMRTLKANEAMELRAADLRRMLTYAIPTVLLKELDIMLKYQFLKAIPSTLAQQLESSSHLLSCEQLVCKARLKSLNTPKEDVRQISPSHQQPAVSPQSIEALQQQVRELQVDIQHVRYQRQHQPPPSPQNRHLMSKEPITCFKCHRQGH
jgi:hypothetical protein